MTAPSPSPPQLPDLLSNLLQGKQREGVVDNEPSSYQWTATKSIGTMYERMVVEVNSLVGALGGSAGMAGSDDAGKSWAASYDKIVSGGKATALGAAADIINTAGVFHNLLIATGNNYSAADSILSPTIEPQSLPGNKETYTPGSVPSAYGGSSSPPALWNLIASYVEGRVWPNGHQDKLHAAADSWRTAAQNILLDAHYLTAAGEKLQAQRAPEIGDILSAFNNLKQQIETLSNQFNQIATECDNYAHAIDDVHHKIIQELLNLGITTGVIEFAGIGLSFFTAGAALGGAQEAAIARLSITGARVARLIDAFADVVRGLSLFGGRIEPTFAGVNGGLAGWRSTGPIVAATKSSGESSGGFSGYNLLRGLEKGDSPKVYVVDSEEKLHALFKELMRGGEIVAAKNYKGVMYLMPDGIKVGLREESSTGGHTIDVFPLEGRRIRVHIKNKEE